MKGSAFLAFVFFVLSFSLLPNAEAQIPRPIDTAGRAAKPLPSPTPSLERRFFKNAVRDQLAIWSAPFRPRNYHAKWAVPLGVGFGALLATDRSTTRWVRPNGGLPVVSRDVSWVGKPYATLGVAGAFYAAGRLTRNARARETGVLAAEALVDTGIVTEVLKFSTQRLRPNSENGSGEFWDGGSSFPSGHSSSVWALATVVGYEYRHNPWIKYGAFTAATAVSMSRYSGRNHFLTDIVVGSALGFYIGRFVFHRYHADTDSTQPKTTTFLKPAFIPHYDGQTRTYGGSLIWRL